VTGREEDAGGPVESLLRLVLAADVGAATFRRLLRHFGSIEGILAAPTGHLARVEGVGERKAASIARAREDREGAARELALAREHGVDVIGFDDARYPPGLRNIYDPPLVLYVRGAIEPRDAMGLAVVGARRCSYYGRSSAERLAASAASAGFTVVSGLARGIDSAAHRGALSAGGRTVAVLGNGLARLFPPENGELADRIASGRGAVVSELPMETEPRRENFPRRNRIISGLSLGVVIVEGESRSGSLITAKWALEQGREVFAVPGKIDTPLSSGPHRLIQDGAKLVTSIDDVLAELGPVADGLEPAAPAAGGGEGKSESGRPAGATGGPAAAELTPHERALYDFLSSDEIDVETLVERSGLAPADVSAALTVLEIRRLAKQLPGQRFVRAR